MLGINLGSCASFVELSSTISTLPFLPNNRVTTSYTNLTFLAQIEDARSYFMCTWRIIQSFGIVSSSIFTTDFYNGTVTCYESNFNTDFLQTCFVMNNTVTSALILLIPINNQFTGLHRIDCYVIEDFHLQNIAEINITVSGKLCFSIACVLSQIE